MQHHEIGNPKRYEAQSGDAEVQHQGEKVWIRVERRWDDSAIARGHNHLRRFRFCGTITKNSIQEQLNDRA